MWIAENLSKEFESETIGLYAGGNASRIFEDGNFKRRDKEVIKKMFKTRDIKLIF